MAKVTVDYILGQALLHSHALSDIIGSAAGNNTNIQFNNAGALDGSNNLTWDGSKVFVGGDIDFSANEATFERAITAQVPTAANTEGTHVSIYGSQGNGIANGGGAELVGADGGVGGGDGGRILLAAGYGTVNGDGGDLEFAAGYGSGAGRNGKYTFNETENTGGTWSLVGDMQGTTQTLTVPKNTGTIALTSDIPAVITDHSALSNLTYASAGHTGFEPTVTKGNLTESTSSVLTISSGTGAVIGTGTTIEVDQADSTNDGYLSSADWNMFNNKPLTFDCTVGTGGDYATVNLAYAAGKRRMKIISNITESSGTTFSDYTMIDGQNYTITMGTQLWTISNTTRFKDIIFSSSNAVTMTVLTSDATATDRSIWDGCTVNLSSSGSVFSGSVTKPVFNKCKFNMGASASFSRTGFTSYNDAIFNDCYFAVTGASNRIDFSTAVNISSTEPTAPCTFNNCIFYGAYNNASGTGRLIYLSSGYYLFNACTVMTSRSRSFQYVFESETDTYAQWNGGYIKILGSSTRLFYSQSDRTHFTFINTRFALPTDCIINSDNNNQFYANFKNCRFDNVGVQIFDASTYTTDQNTVVENCVNLDSRNGAFYKNTSGGDILVGSTVVLNTDGGMTTTTTRSNGKVLGKVNRQISNNTFGFVVTEGKVIKLKVNGTDDIAAGDLLTTYTDAGVACKAAYNEISFAVALEAYTGNDSNGLIAARLLTPRSQPTGSFSGTYLTLDQTTPQSVINGRATFAQGLLLGTSPTVGAHADGKVYYDATYKTISADIAGDVTLQLGQEDHVLVYNGTGSPITNGQVVYFSTASGGLPSVALAKADNINTAFTLGVATQTIADSNTGLITVRGEIHDIDTTGTPYSETWNVGDVLYLSSTTAGGLTNVVPSVSAIEARVGRVLEVDATTGEIYVSQLRAIRVTDLADATVTTPTVDQVLKYNGTEWVNGAPATSSASAGIEFFNATPIITATGANNDVQIATLSKTPVTTAEQTVTISMATNTVTGSAWLYDTALGRTSIDAGVWDFDTYAAVNSVAGGRVTTITRQVYSVLPTSGGVTVTVTGSGTSRTATASGGTYFATSAIDASATNTTASFLQTPQGLYQITARTSDTVVTILTPTTYSNESGVTFNVWKKLFGSTSPTITATGTNYSLFAHTSVQSAFTITTAHKLGGITFGTSNNTTTVTLTYNGNARNSHFQTPLITLHGNLAGLQGGTGSVPTEEYYHLTSAQHTVATQAASGSVNGYLSSTDWSTFNNKEPAVTKGNLTETTSSVLTITGGTNAVIGSGTTIEVDQADTSNDGYLSSTDWNTFNNKINGIPWSAITADQTAVVNNGYIINKAGLLLLALPATSAVGTVIEVAGQTSQWAITQAANQYIVFGNQTSTVGVGGSLANNLAGDCVSMVCIEADKGWMVKSSVGNLVIT